MAGLYVGMPLMDIMNVLEDIKIEERFKRNILNFIKQELEYGNSQISNEIELSMLQAWLNNSDEIVMPELLSDKYELKDIYSMKKGENTITYEKFSSQDGTFYSRRIIRDKNNVVIKVTLSHKTSFNMDIAENGGVEDHLTDRNNDGLADIRTVIITKSSDTRMLNDIDLDGKTD